MYAFKISKIEPCSQLSFLHKRKTVTPRREIHSHSSYNGKTFDEYFSEKMEERK